MARAKYYTMGPNKGMPIPQDGGSPKQPSLADMFAKMGKESLDKNVAREQEIRGLYSNILSSLTGSNASLRASGLKDIETKSKQMVGKESQNLISSGLYGTTTAASIPSRVESEFAQPSRLKLEDLISSRTREAQLGLAGFIERIQNPYPDFNTLLQGQIAESSTKPSHTRTINAYSGFKSL